MDCDSDEEECVSFGTALEPYEEDEIPKKKSAFQDITEQYALDSQGKRRFHGAFTGGFSAGHWNTVSTPEGWAPQSFKSSRSSRMQLTQKAEDFMDDEDRSEFGIAPRSVHTTNEFSGQKRKNQKMFHEGPIPGDPVLHTLLEPVHETAAIRILKNMGWRPGFGVGEKITIREKKAARKTYSCHIPHEYRKEFNIPSNSDDEDSEEEYSDILFEPDDFKPFVVKPKLDNFGLGYTGLSRHSILGKDNTSSSDSLEWKGSHLKTNDKGKKVSIRGQAFGVGALEEEDEDIYEKDNMSNYDYIIDNPANEKEDVAKKNVSSGYKTVLEGFAIGSGKYKISKEYLPPALPKNYMPNYTNIKKSRFESTSDSNGSNIVRDPGLGRHDLTVKDRSKILNEEVNEVKINNNENQSSGDIINKTKTKSEDNVVKKNTSEGIEESTDITASTELEEKNKSTLNIHGDMFKPFVNHPKKQKRYEEFLEMKKDKKTLSVSNHYGLYSEKDALSNWEISKELCEFEQAFKLYKPLCGAMSERFTTAIFQDDTPSNTANKTYKSSYASNEMHEAAHNETFGHKTRNFIEWRPDSLLCRRFNIPEPNNTGPTGLSSEKKNTSYSIFEYFETSIHSKNSYIKEQNDLKIALTNDSVNTKPSQSIKSQCPLADSENNKIKNQKRLTVAELFLQEKEKENTASSKTNNDKLLQEKMNESDSSRATEMIDSFNKIDLYKAIFLSDSDSDSDRNSNVPETSKPKINTQKTDEKIIIKSTSPPRGIFANVDFDRLNSWRNQNNESMSELSKTKLNTVEAKKSSYSKTDLSCKNEGNGKKESDDVDVYGPKLPDKAHVIAKIDVLDKKTIDSDSSDSSDWVETDRVREKSDIKNKKSKKKKKKKSHKHKYKTKHKHK